MISRRSEYMVAEVPAWSGKVMVGVESIMVDGGILPRRAGAGGNYWARTLRGEDIAFLQEYVFCLYRYVVPDGSSETLLGDPCANPSSLYDDEVADILLRASRVNGIVEGLNDLAETGLFSKGDPVEPAEPSYSSESAEYKGGSRVNANLPPVRDLVPKIAPQTVANPDLDPAMTNVKPGDALRLKHLRAMFTSAAALRYPISVMYADTFEDLDGTGAGDAELYVPTNVLLEQRVCVIAAEFVGGVLDGTTAPAQYSGTRRAEIDSGTTVAFSGGVMNRAVNPVRGYGNGRDDRVVFAAQALAWEEYRRPRTTDDTVAPGTETAAKLVTIVGTGTVSTSGTTVYLTSDDLKVDKVLSEAFGREVGKGMLPDPPDGSDIVQKLIYDESSDDGLIFEPENSIVGNGRYYAGVRFVRAVVAGKISDDIDFEKAYPGWAKKVPDK